MKNKLVPLVIFVLLGGFFVQEFFGSSSGKKPPINSGSAVKVLEDISLYALQATNNSWPKLNQEAELAENLLTKNFYLVLDGSGSMQGKQCTDGRTKMDAAKEALMTFTRQLDSQANIGLIIFDANGVSERVPLGGNSSEAVVQAISQARAGGGTPLSAVISNAYSSLNQQATRQLGYGDYNLVVVTDGEASPNYQPDTVVRGILSESPVVLHTIGFCIKGNHSLNQSGRTFYKAANDPESLASGLADILAEVQDFSVTEFNDD